MLNKVNKELFLILSIALIIRLMGIAQSLWLDEAITALVAKNGLWAYFTQFTPTDFHPPLHYLITIAFTKIFGLNDFVLRLPSLIAGTLLIIPLYDMGNRLKSKAGSTIAILTATSPLLVYYSQEARMYTLAAFLVILAVWFYHAPTTSRRFKYLFPLSLSLSFLTHYLALLMLPVFLLHSRFNKKLFLPLMSSLLPLILWLPIFYRQLILGLNQVNTTWADILGRPTLKNVLLIPVKFIMGRISYEPFSAYLLSVVLILVVFFWLITRQKLTNKAIRFPLLWLIFPPLSGFLISFFIPLLTYFRFLFALPALYILLGQGIHAITSPIKKSVALVIVIGIHFSLLSTYITTPEFQREPWKQLVNDVNAKAPQDTLVVFTFPGLPAPWEWYASKDVSTISVLPGPSLPSKLSIYTQYDQIFLVTYSQDIFDPNQETLTWLTSHGYRETGFYQYPGIGKILLLSKPESFALR